jgi:hypothetical protein
MDDDLGPLRESARSPSQEKCASKCIRSIVLSAFIYFLAQMDLRLEILDARFEILNLKFEI